MPEPLFVAVPATVQLLNGNDKSVVESTVKEAFGLLVKANWRTPLPSIRTPVKTGGDPTTYCVTGISWPSTVINAVRRVVVLLKAKLTTPLVMPVMVTKSH